ncbi:DNA-binding protein [Sinorhizobium fredii]|uniref:DNA-binding protein n=1 Tax=Rhizobium fredii TaxID=380 RepID=UPI00351384EB
MTTTEVETPSQIDLIWGAEEISKVIGRPARVTFHLLTTGAIPAKKVGGRWVAERGKLLRFFMETAA